MITFSMLGNHGRLGNQMFQYAVLNSISLRNNFNFYIPKHNHQLSECFNITCKAYDLQKQETLQIVSRLNRFREISFNFNREIFNIPDNTDISGNFQSEKYFSDFESEIRKQFTFKNEIHQEAKKQFNFFKESYQAQELVSIHIRRGDYVNLQEYHPVCELEYYLKAIKLVTEKVDKKIKFLVFSDEIDWCKSNLNNNENCIFSSNINPYIDLCLMSMCEHNIIANSSYSWWGAWLNENPDKIVIAPNKWFGPKYSHHNITDLIPEKWIKL